MAHNKPSHPLANFRPLSISGMVVSEAGKSCGDCGLCCKLLGVEAIGKKNGQWCAHFRKGVGGCGIYEERPNACRTFVCLWLTSDRLDESWKPSRSKIILYPDESGRRLNVVVDPGDPLAWKREPYYRRIKAMSVRAEDGFELVVGVGDRRFVVFPHEDVDLGVINPDHKIVSGYAQVDGELTPYAMVLSDLPEERDGMGV